MSGCLGFESNLVIHILSQAPDGPRSICLGNRGGQGQTLDQGQNTSIGGNVNLQGIFPTSVLKTKAS